MKNCKGDHEMKNCSCCINWNIDENDIEIGKCTADNCELFDTEWDDYCGDWQSNDEETKK